MRCLSLLTLFLLIGPLPLRGEEPTSITLNGQVYGARADAIGPIGGGSSYTRTITRGDFTAGTLDELLEALAEAKPGQTIFIPGETMIDCTARVYIEDLVLQIPAGVTLAGNRGQDGSKGALICSDALKTRPLIRVIGPDVRITGLRIQGPNPKRYLDHHHRSFAEGRGHKYYYKFPVSDGIQTEHPRLEVDNCEISAWSHGGIYLMKGDGHHIHHCFIHNCQYAGLGYGICHDTASSVIERNIFDFNRHSIAGTGRPGCSYEAHDNLQLGTSLSHCFDMHGGRDRKDGTNIAGTKILIHHNTFRSEQTPIVIRGVPQEECRVFNNWFVKCKTAGDAVHALEKTKVDNNAYGPKSSATAPPG